MQNGFFHLHNIRRIRKYLPHNSAEILVHAFITTRVDYCNSLLFGLPHYQRAKLQYKGSTMQRLGWFAGYLSSVIIHLFWLLCIGFQLINIVLNSRSFWSHSKQLMVLLLIIFAIWLKRKSVLSITYEIMMRYYCYHHLVNHVQH